MLSLLFVLPFDSHQVHNLTKRNYGEESVASVEYMSVLPLETLSRTLLKELKRGDCCFVASVKHFCSSACSMLLVCFM